MGVIRHKIWYDLWSQKARTLQVVLIIAIGASAIGVILGSRTLVIAGMSEIWRSSSPAMVTLWTDQPIDEGTLAVLARTEGIEAIEGYSQVTIAWRKSTDDRWRPAALIARDDYENQTYTRLGLISGEWPRGRTLAIGQGADVIFGVAEGEQVYVRINDHDYLVTIAGTLYDPIAQPPSFGGNVQFFTTRDRMGELTENYDFNRILAGSPEFDQAALIQAVDTMQDRLERQEINSGGFLPPFGSRISHPDEHFFQNIMDGVFLILGIMAILALGLGLLLVYNTIEAIVSRQVDQIGVMKAIGATSRQILFVYLCNVFAYGLLALLIAIPVGLAGSWALNVFLLNNFNADPGSFRVAPVAIGAQVLVALLAPLLASLVPVLSGVRITVREAISTYGLQAKTGTLESLLAKIEAVPRLFLLTVSNTFRHKGRVILTQVTLILSGIIFMVVMSVRDSTVHTFNDVLKSINQYNVFLVFQSPERIDQIETLTERHPDAHTWELWYQGGGSIQAGFQAESQVAYNATVFGLPADTTLYVPQIVTGRWLSEEDSAAVVLNERLAEQANVGVDDWITIDHGVYGETTWQVVGLLFDPNNVTSVHVPRHSLLRELGMVGKANRIYIQTHSGPANEEQSEQSFRDYYESYRVELSPGGGTISEVADNVMGQFAIIVTLLSVMAVVVGVVGSVALSGVLSLNVIDRRREIGVMRAVGASSRDVGSLFVGEGLILGWISWLIALPFAVPLGYLMAQGLGAIVQVNLVYKYTPIGSLAWLGIITLLSVFASYFPARKALRLSVRESLAYQ